MPVDGLDDDEGVRLPTGGGELVLPGSDIRPTFPPPLFDGGLASLVDPPLEDGRDGAVDGADCGGGAG